MITGYVCVFSQIGYGSPLNQQILTLKMFGRRSSLP